MSQNYNDGLPLLEEEGEGNSQGDSSNADKTKLQSDAKPGGDAAGAGGSPDQQTVPLERFKAVEAQIQTYRELGLDGLAEELRRDPSKIHDIRAALAGRTLHEPTPVREEPKVDQAQVREAFTRLNETDPMAAQMLVAQAAVQAGLKEVLEPIRQLTFRQSVEMFKAKSRSGVPYFHMIEPYFDQLVARRNLTGLSAQQVEAALGEVLFTAMGIAYAQSLNKAQASGKLPRGGRPSNEPINMGTGRSSDGGGDQGRRREAVDSDTDKALRAMAKWGGLDEKETEDALNR